MSQVSKRTAKTDHPQNKKVAAKKSHRKVHASPPTKKITSAKTIGGGPLDNRAVHKGAIVEWAWGVNRAVGKVMEVFSEKVHKTLKGKVITRNATPEKRAALVKAASGGRVLKSVSELKAPRKRAIKPSKV